MTIDSLLLAHWERSGTEAFLRYRSRDSNPKVQRGPRIFGLQETESEWKAKRDAWWRGWDDAFASAPSMLTVLVTPAAPVLQVETSAGKRIASSQPSSVRHFDVSTLRFSSTTL